MRAALILAAALFVTSAHAADCPPAKALTCAQLQQRLSSRCGLAVAPVDPDPIVGWRMVTTDTGARVATPMRNSDKPTTEERVAYQARPEAVNPPPCPSVTCEGPSTIEITRTIAAYCHDNAAVANVYVPRDHGVPLLSAGAGYFNGPTVDFGAGWRFQNGMDVIGSAVWGDLASHDTSTYSYGRDPDDGNHHHDEDYNPPLPVAYTTTDDSHRSTWGGRISLTIPLRHKHKK